MKRFKNIFGFSSLTSITVNGEMSLLPAMSAQLRHSSLNTTQKYYYRMERGVAGKQLKDARKHNPIISQKAVIDKKFNNTGYV